MSPLNPFPLFYVYSELLIIDRVADIALTCKDMQIPHVINNAYGVQSSKLMHFVNEAMRLVYKLKFVHTKVET